MFVVVLDELDENRVGAEIVIRTVDLGFRLHTSVEEDGAGRVTPGGC